MYEIDVADIGIGSKNVTSRFRVDPADRTVVAFPRRLSYKSHSALMKTGHCTPLYVVPAQHHAGGKHFHMGIAIPTPDPEGSFRSVYYLFEASHEKCGVEAEAEDKRSVAQFHVVTELSKVRSSGKLEERQEGVHYIYDGDYNMMVNFLN